MKSKTKQREVKKWEMFALLGDDCQLYDINGDGFLLENKMYEMCGRFPYRKFEIISVLISEVPTPSKTLKAKKRK